MNWTKYTFRQSEIGTFLQRQDLPMAMREFLLTNDGVATLEWFVREFMVNEDGVWINPWGKSVGWQNHFRYWHGDIRIKFLAWRPRGTNTIPGLEKSLLAKGRHLSGSSEGESSMSRHRLGRT
jgi:hypothetical protein